VTDITEKKRRDNPLRRKAAAKLKAGESRSLPHCPFVWVYLVPTDAQTRLGCRQRRSNGCKWQTSTCRPVRISSSPAYLVVSPDHLVLPRLDLHLEDFAQVVGRSSLGQVLDEQNRVGRQVLVGTDHQVRWAARDPHDPRQEGYCVCRIRR
jgi:hypothetical protein